MKGKLSTKLSTYPQDIPLKRMFTACGEMLTTFFRKRPPQGSILVSVENRPFIQCISGGLSQNCPEAFFLYFQGEKDFSTNPQPLLRLRRIFLLYLLKGVHHDHENRMPESRSAEKRHHRNESSTFQDDNADTRVYSDRRVVE